MNSLSALGKYLDQPLLVAKFSKAVPAMLIGGGSVFAASHIFNSPKKERKKETVKSFAVLTGTIASALIATRGIKPFKIGNKLFKGFEGLSERIDVKEVKKKQSELIHNFLSKNKITSDIEKTLTKAKENILGYSEIKTIYKGLKRNREFLDEFIPNPENIDSKEIFSEIKRLSIMGLVPVLGGITGGIIGDKLTEKDWKKRVPDKIKEGTYQYLANIFLCNIGAGVALWGLEKANIKSKSARAVSMVGGILLTGVVFGSAVANLIGRNIVNPLIGGKSNKSKLYSERTPEAIDIGLHIDDVATVAVLSGLKWIEPALPVLYSISGYRAGIGYRNGE